MRTILWLAVILIIAGCSTTARDPQVNPGTDCIEKVKPTEEPVDGGIGGTGALPGDAGNECGETSSGPSKIQ